MNTIEQQTGWKRTYPGSICQEHKTLLAISEYSFDLDDLRFVEYFKARTGICVGQEENPDLARFLLTDPGADQWITESPDYKYLTGVTVPFGKARAIQVESNKIMKGRLQDCWENYLTAQKRSSALADPDGSFKQGSRSNPVQLELFDFNHITEAI